MMQKQAVIDAEHTIPEKLQKTAADRPTPEELENSATARLAKQVAKLPPPRRDPE